MGDPTQQDTIDPCSGGALLGGSRHIWGYVRSGFRPADQCVGEVLSGGAVQFFITAPSVCRGLNCSPPPPAGRSREWVRLYVGRIVTANI
jgi:hypothetical protein